MLDATPNLDVESLNKPSANKIAEIIAVAAVGKTPYVGGLLGPLVGAIWPSSGPNLWDQIKGEVQALVSQDIAKNNLANIHRKLKGIQDNLQEYNAMSDATPSDKAAKQDKLISIETNMVTLVPTFLSGDIVNGFSCFWGMALLHLSALHDLHKVYDVSGYKEIYHKKVNAYSYFGKVATRCMYNRRMGKLSFTNNSGQIPGKNSQYNVVVLLTDTKTGTELVDFTHYYRHGWTPQQIQQDSSEANSQLSSAWSTASSAHWTTINNTARTAIFKMRTAPYKVSRSKCQDYLKDMMITSDYDTFINNNVPQLGQNPQCPSVNLWS